MPEIIDPPTEAQSYETIEAPTEAADTTTPDVEEVPELPDSEEREAGSDDTDIKPDEFFGAHLEAMIQTGEISEEALAKVAEANGVSLRQATLEAKALLYERTQAVAKMHDAAGGKAQWEEIKSWVSSDTSTLTDADVDRINATIKLGGTAATAAVHELRARFEQQRAKPGPTPKRVTGSPPAKQGPKPFQSWGEVQQAMGTMEYSTDPAYRADIEARLKVSNI
jgi:hypothetical protein